MIENIAKDDVVLVTGATVNEGGVKTIHRTLAKVLAVGKSDVFAMLMTREDYNRPFKVPTSRCKKVELQNITFVEEPIKPKIGDLVISIVSYFGKLEEKIGRLKSIILKPGREKEGILFCGTKEEKVSYASLMVLEE